MRILTLALLALVSAALAGCADAPDETTWFQEGIQCESKQWDEEAYGGSNRERVDRLVGFYESEGYTVVNASIVDSDMIVPALCGSWTGDWYVITIEGPFDAAGRHGWEEGSPDTN